MARPTSSRRRLGTTTVSIGALVAIAALTLAGSSVATAATSLAGPIDLGASEDFGVLAGGSLTNTGTTVVDGDIGISPGTSITGFDGAPGGTHTGVRHDTDAVAADAQAALTEAIGDAASLTPAQSDLSDLSGLNLSPGVYAGDALLLPDNQTLTLSGSAESVWVFQAASSLTIQSGTRIDLQGGASACNVFWLVGSSATLVDGAQFVGTILSQFDISVGAAATVEGRLLAKRDVTLIQDLITVPQGCAPGVAPVYTEAPTITSGEPTAATAGMPYSYAVTATGSPTPSYTVTSGELPAGLVLDGATGVIGGTPTTPGTSTFTITVSNGVGPDASTTYTITTAAPVATAEAELAETGSSASTVGALSAGMLLLGAAVMIGSRRRRAVRA